MLLEFSVGNYKSFKEPVTFSMVPYSKQRKMNYSIAKAKIRGKVYKSLSSSVIYGPNASGKTNLIGAMDSFRSIVLRGNLRNGKDEHRANIASAHLELIPNYNNEIAEPVFFTISVIENNLLFQYNLSVDLGVFSESDYPRKVLEESLSINREKIFCRTNTVEIFLKGLNSIRQYWNDGLSENQETAVSLSKGSLKEDELFLTNGFKNIFCSKMSDMILGWFEKSFCIVYRADSIRSVPKVQKNKKSIYVDKQINEAIRCFGEIQHSVGYVTQENGRVKLCSMIDRGNDIALIDIEEFESYGTVRFINLFPLIVVALKNGGTLVVDEFDASIHPMALMNIINIFHNDEINKNHAQLIFNTHNPIFLNANLFRRDEIHFVERDEEMQSSVHYTLEDFERTGNNQEDYMKNYFVNRYGAIQDVDFSPLIVDILSSDKEKENGNEKKNNE